MNREKILLLIKVVVILTLGLAGFSILRYKSLTKDIQQGNIPIRAFPDGPLDTAIAVVSIVSVENKTANVRVEEIRSYNRYPGATYQKLEVSDKINTKIYNIVLSYDSSDKKYAQRADESTVSLPPSPEVGKKYLADMRYCKTNYFDGLSCDYDGWSSSLSPL